jgi:PKD repeat protein
MYMTSDGGSSWSNITSGLPVSSSSITFISVKDDDPNTVWVSLSGFNGYGVYESTDGGSSWTNISAGLPQLPTNCVVQDTSGSDLILYAGTDVGIYVKDGTNDWEPFYDGLPNVNVTELEIYYDNNDPADSRIRAATFGRGVWESPLYSSVLAPETDFTADNTAPYTIDTVSFTDISTNEPTSWDWEIDPETFTFVNETDANSQNPEVRFDAEGLYSVTLTASNAGGSDTEIKTDYIDVTILVIAPVCDFVADTTHSSTSDTVSFTDLSANMPDSWDWDFDPETVTFLDGTSETSQHPKVRFDEAGIYSVTLNVENSAGSDIEEKLEYINTVDVLSVSVTADPEAICEEGSSQLFAEPTGGEEVYTYSWTSDPEGFTSDEQNPLVEPQATTTYFVEVTDGFQAVAGDVMVTVNSIPEITLIDWPELLCHELEPPVQLYAVPEGGVYSGEFVTEQGVFSPEDATLGWHVITYFYEDENGCENSAQDSIFVDDCVGINSFNIDQSRLVVYPNPNNGEFVIESDATIVSIELFNQHGKLIYTVLNNQNSLRFNLSIDKGIYYLKAKLNLDDKEVWVTKKVLIN